MHPDAFRKAQAVVQAVTQAMVNLDIEYIELMQRLGCKNFRMWRL